MARFKSNNQLTSAERRVKANVVTNLSQVINRNCATLCAEVGRVHTADALVHALLRIEPIYYEVFWQTVLKQTYFNLCGTSADQVLAASACEEPRRASSEPLGFAEEYVKSLIASRVAKAMNNEANRLYYEEHFDVIQIADVLIQSLIRLDGGISEEFWRYLMEHLSLHLLGLELSDVLK